MKWPRLWRWGTRAATSIVIIVLVFNVVGALHSITMLRAELGIARTIIIKAQQLHALDQNAIDQANGVIADMGDAGHKRDLTVNALASELRRLQNAGCKP